MIFFYRKLRVKKIITNINFFENPKVPKFVFKHGHKLLKLLGPQS